jgi:hypothetical protein
VFNALAPECTPQLAVSSAATMTAAAAAAQHFEQLYKHMTKLKQILTDKINIL